MTNFSCHLAWRGGLLQRQLFSRLFSSSSSSSNVKAQRIDYEKLFAESENSDNEAEFLELERRLKSIALSSTSKRRKIHPVRQEGRIFRDRARFTAHAGAGGSGCESFSFGRVGKHSPPDGGKGGTGGDIIIKVAEDTYGLAHVPTFVEAANGKRGGSQNKSGENGSTSVIRVPPGTIVRSTSRAKMVAGNPFSGLELLADLKEIGEELLIAKGGEGGKGNSAYGVGARHRAARTAENGRAGQVVNVELEVKLIADAGLVGAPNSGKSSLLSALSRATPRVGSYAFTTLHPYLGTMIFDDYVQLRVADLPGLLVGSLEERRGVGARHLRHATRATVLCIVVDAARGDVVGLHRYKQVIDELAGESSVHKRTRAVNKRRTKSTTVASIALDATSDDVIIGRADPRSSMSVREALAQFDAMKGELLAWHRKYPDETSVIDEPSADKATDRIFWENNQADNVVADVEMLDGEETDDIEASDVNDEDETNFAETIESNDNNENDDEKSNSSIDWRGGRGVVVVANKLDLLEDSVGALLKNTVDLYEVKIPNEWRQTAEKRACMIRLRKLSNLLAEHEVDAICGISALSGGGVDTLKSELRRVIESTRIRNARIEQQEEQLKLQQ